MNRVLTLMRLGIQSLIFTAGSAHGADIGNLELCLRPDLCSSCKLELASLITAPKVDSDRGCRKMALALFPSAESLLALYPHQVNRLSGAIYPWARAGLALPDNTYKSNPEGAVRPRTGGQLYAQRLASLADGQLYSRITPSTYGDQWQTAWQHPSYEQWQALLAQEAALMAVRQGNSPLTVLVGDSLYLWLTPENLTHDRLWLNQSISGEMTSHVLQRLTYFARVRPETIVVMAGVNDLKSNVAPRLVVSNLELIVQRLKIQHPQARVVVLSILPTRRPALSGSMLQHINRQIAIAAWQQGGEFVDLQPAFMDSQGLLRLELTTDGIHLNPQGYRLLAAQLNSVADGQ